MGKDLTDKQLKEIERIKNAGDYTTSAEVKRVVAKIGIRALLKEYGLDPLPADEV